MFCPGGIISLIFVHDGRSRIISMYVMPPCCVSDNVIL